MLIKHEGLREWKINKDLWIKAAKTWKIKKIEWLLKIIHLKGCISWKNSYKFC